MLLHGPWQPEFSGAIESSRSKSLVVGVEFEGDNLDFLSSLPSLERLRVDALIADDRGIEHCNRLVDLMLFTGAGCSLDLSRLPRLRRLQVQRQALGYESLSACHEIEELRIDGLSTDNLGFMKGSSALASLDIRNAPRLSALDGIEGASSTLKMLSVYNAPKLSNLEALASLEVLEEIEFEDCTSVYDLGVCSSVQTLKAISINNCGAIKSLRPIERLSKLKKVFGWGSTLIEDGDTDVLHRSKSIRQFSLAQRASYNAITRSS